MHPIPSPPSWRPSRTAERERSPTPRTRFRRLSSDAARKVGPIGHARLSLDRRSSEGSATAFVPSSKGLPRHRLVPCLKLGPNLAAVNCKAVSNPNREDPHPSCSGVPSLTRSVVRQRGRLPAVILRTERPWDRFPGWHRYSDAKGTRQVHSPHASPSVSSNMK